MTPLVHELKRKFFHVFSAFYALLYILAGREASLWTLGAFFCLTGAVEAVRLRNPRVNEKLIALFGGIHREFEEKNPSGILWTLGGSFLTIWLIPHPDVVLAGLWYLALGDGAAAVVGRSWGHIRIGSKSLEGSLACFLACWGAGTLCLAPAFGAQEALLGALAATVVEILPLPLNDNLWMPLLPGLLLTFLRAAG